jgi:hypothetical protein
MAYTFTVFQFSFEEESMFSAHCLFIRLLRIGRIAVVPVFASVSLLAQSAAHPSIPAPPAATAQTPSNGTSPAPCKHSAVSDIPLSSTIQAKVAGTLDSAHLKVGKEIWVYIDNDVAYPGCTLNAGSTLYAHVTAATSGQGSNTSELSLSFNHADCQEQRKKAMPMRLIAIVGPLEGALRIHEELPVTLRGAQRNINDPVKAMAGSRDKYNTEVPPRIFRPGSVIGIPTMKLEVEGGPGCSARISSTNHSVLLDRGTELIMVVESQ